MDCFETSNETPHQLFKWQHKWKIEKYKEVLKFFQDRETKECITSPPFNINAIGITLSGTSFGKLTFELQLYPIGIPGQENNETNLRIFNKSSTKLVFKPVFSILKDNDQKRRTTEKYLLVVDVAECKGFLKPDLVDDDVSSDGSLVICIELEILLQSISWTLVRRKKIPPSEILNLKRLREVPLFSDMQLTCGGETFHVHKNILSLCSPVFETMLSNEYLVEGRTSCVEIQDSDSLVMRKMLDFIYTGNTECLEENTIEILAVANKYDIQELKQECELILTSKLTSENAVDYLNMAFLYEAKILKEAALRFVASNISCVGDVSAMTSLDNVQNEVWKELFIMKLRERL